jgi:hypothetical protein
MPKVNEPHEHLQPGQVYRRADLTKWSNAVDRHLQQLVGKGAIQKLEGVFTTIPRKRLLVMRRQRTKRLSVLSLGRPFLKFPSDGSAEAYAGFLVG